MLFINREKVNIIHGQLNEDNLDSYFKTAVKLYNKADFENALLGFEKLTEYKDEYRILLIPHIEKCRHIKNITRTENDKIHFANQIILKKFGWIDYVKYVIGLLSVGLLISALPNITTFRRILVFVGGAYPPNQTSYADHFRIVNFILAICFAIIIFFVHFTMKKYTASKKLVRCKYCGRYIRYIDPDTPRLASAITNNCHYCGRMYPVPDFYWDSWEGLEYIKQQHSVPEPDFYSELQKLKENYNKVCKETKQKSSEKKNL
jgi:hypothetical protein